MGSMETIKARQKRKEDLVYIHGGKCIICGYCKYIGALHFHHLNPKEKSYRLSQGHCHSWEDDINESKKCALVCSNCHAEIHAGLKEITFSTFNEERFEEKEKEREKSIYLCNRCGKELSYKANYCSECYHYLIQRVERPTRDELKKMIREMPFTQIGEKYGVTDNAIRKWCIKYNLPSKKGIINKYSDEEWEQI